MAAKPSAPAPNQKLIAVTLDEATIGRSNEDIEHERAVAIFDLLEDNQFAPVNHAGGPYALALSIEGNRLVLKITEEDGEAVATHILSLSPLRRVVKDYYLICESYYDAIRNAKAARIEAIDMSRRAIHDEASKLLVERLARKVRVDFDTARRIFTLICVLHWKG